MRIEALRLEHYGAFAQRNLQLGGKAPLTVVYGPNEAGKNKPFGREGFPLRSSQPDAADGGLWRRRHSPFGHLAAGRRDGPDAAPTQGQGEDPHR